MEIFVQDIDAISTRLEDLDINSKAERVDINENLISTSEKIHDLTSQVQSVNRTLNKIQSTQRKEENMTGTYQKFGSERDTKSRVNLVD